MNENKEILISVIIVACNVENFISICLRSILSQYLQNIEIIVVNDASTDNTSTILSNIVEKDNRVSVVNNEKYIGYYSSIKIGLQTAKGRYIHFVNPCDYLVPYAYKELYEYALINQLDIVLFAHFIVKNNKTKFCNINYKLRSYQKRILSSHIDKQFLLNSQTVFTTWNTLFKKDFLVENNFFSEKSVNFSEFLLMWQIFILANKISFLNIPLYYYNYKNTNIKASNKKVDKRDIIEIIHEIYSFLDKNNCLQSYAIIFSKAVLRNYIGYFNKLSKKNKKDFLNKIQDSLKYMKLSRFLKNGKLKRKIIIIKKTKFPLLNILVKTKIIT